MANSSLKEHRLVDLALKTAELEFNNPDHPVNRFSEHLNDHYFGLGKVRTLKPDDPGVLSQEDHHAMDRMHSRLSLLLDLSGRRDEAQSHLAAARHHYEQAKQKKQQGELVHTQGSEEREVQAPSIKPSPFLNRKKALSPDDRVRVRVSSPQDKKRVEEDLSGNVENVYPEGVYQATIRPDDEVGLIFQNRHDSRVRVEKLPKEEKSFKQITDSLGRKRCFNNGKPVSCGNKGSGKKESSRGSSSSGKTAKTPNGKVNVPKEKEEDLSLGLDLVDNVLEVLSSLSNNELETLHQRVGGSLDLTSNQVSKEIATTYLFSLAPETRTKRMKALSPGDRVRIRTDWGDKKDSVIDEEGVIDRIEDSGNVIAIANLDGLEFTMRPESHTRIEKLPEKKNLLNIRRKYQKMLRGEVKANRHIRHPDGRKIVSTMLEQDCYDNPNPLRITRGSTPNTYRIHGYNNLHNEPVVREVPFHELDSTIREMANLYDQGTIHDETGDYYKHLKKGIRYTPDELKEEGRRIYNNIGGFDEEAAAELLIDSIHNNPNHYFNSPEISNDDVIPGTHEVLQGVREEYHKDKNKKNLRKQVKSNKGKTPDVVRETFRQEARQRYNPGSHQEIDNWITDYEEAFGPEAWTINEMFQHHDDLDDYFTSQD